MRRRASRIPCSALPPRSRHHLARWRPWSRSLPITRAFGQVLLGAVAKDRFSSRQAFLAARWWPRGPVAASCGGGGGALLLGSVGSAGLLSQRRAARPQKLGDASSRYSAVRAECRACRGPGTDSGAARDRPLPGACRDGGGRRGSRALSLSEQLDAWSGRPRRRFMQVTARPHAATRRLDDGDGGYRKVVLVSATPPGPMRPAVTACSRYSAIRLMPRHCGPRAWAVPTNSMPAPRTALRTQRRPFGPGILAGHDRKLATSAQVRDRKSAGALGRSHRHRGRCEIRLDLSAIEDIASGCC